MNVYKVKNYVTSSFTRRRERSKKNGRRKERGNGKRKIKCRRMLVETREKEEEEEREMKNMDRRESGYIKNLMLHCIQFPKTEKKKVKN